MARKEQFNYFDCFVRMAEYSSAAANLLMNLLKEFSPDNLSAKIVEMHEIEHSADLLKHELLERLAREFIAPIEREDIVTLSQEIDNVTDSIEDVLLRMYMFRVQALRDEVFQFTELIVKCCTAQEKMMQEFKHFRKSNVIKDYIVEINRLEEVGDRLYSEAMYNLFEPGTDPVIIMTLTEVFDHLEHCCDACEDAADIVEGVIMKNS